MAPSSFEMDPSPYHLGTCNAPVVGEDGRTRLCGARAVRRVLGLGPAELNGDQRRCAAHLETEQDSQ